MSVNTVNYVVNLLGMICYWVLYSDADRTAFEGLVRFLQKWSGPGPVQGLVIWSAVRSAVQKYAKFCALPKKLTLFTYVIVH